MLCPTVDGSKGAPSAFDGPDGAERMPLASMTLESTKPLDGGALWLRYRVQKK